MKTPILAVVTGILLNADVAFADELARPNVLFIRLLCRICGWKL
jgi:hypothetical protein